MSRLRYVDVPAKKPPTLVDDCAACRRPIMVHETTWEQATTVWGLWARANLCGDVACEAVHDADVYSIARELRRRLERRKVEER